MAYALQMLYFVIFGKVEILSNACFIKLQTEKGIYYIAIVEELETHICSQYSHG